MEADLGGVGVSQKSAERADENQHKRGSQQSFWPVGPPMPGDGEEQVGPTFDGKELCAAGLRCATRAAGSGVDQCVHSQPDWRAENGHTHPVDEVGAEGDRSR